MNKTKWCYPNLSELDEVKASTIIESYEMIARTVSRIDNELGEKYCRTCPHRKLEDSNVEFECIENKEICDCAVMKIGYISDATEEYVETINMKDKSPQPQNEEKAMTEENLNPWDIDYKIRAYDYVKKEWRDFGLMELTEEDWRKWVCWKLEQIQKTSNAQHLSNLILAKNTVESIKGIQECMKHILKILQILSIKKENPLSLALDEMHHIEIESADLRKDKK